MNGSSFTQTETNLSGNFYSTINRSNFFLSTNNTFVLCLSFANNRDSMIQYYFYHQLSFDIWKKIRVYRLFISNSRTTGKRAFPYVVYMCISITQYKILFGRSINYNYIMKHTIQSRITQLYSHYFKQFNTVAFCVFKQFNIGIIMIRF